MAGAIRDFCLMFGWAARAGTIRIDPKDLEAFVTSRRREEKQPSRPMPGGPDGFGDYYSKIMGEVERKKNRR